MISPTGKTSNALWAWPPPGRGGPSAAQAWAVAAQAPRDLPLPCGSGESCRARRGRSRRHVFTLIELVCVLMLLAVILGLTAPRLARFFHGRSVTGEARRLLAVTRYARTQAVARAWPVAVWFEPDTRRYGVEPAPGLEDGTGRIDQFRMADGVGLSLGDDSPKPGSRATIWFEPNGTIAEDSPDSLSLFALGDEQDLLRITRDPDSPCYRVEP
jgi:type II secretory pathway pseudopilin PulG